MRQRIFNLQTKINAIFTQVGLEFEVQHPSDLSLEIAAGLAGVLEPAVQTNVGNIFFDMGAVDVKGQAISGKPGCPKWL